MSYYFNVETALSEPFGMQKLLWHHPNLESIGGFVIVYNELKNDFMGRAELVFGGIDCEFGGPACFHFCWTQCYNFFNDLV